MKGTFRILLAVMVVLSFAPAIGAAIQDSDDDGVADIYDECPGSAEDFDGFEDSDGCWDAGDGSDGGGDDGGGGGSGEDGDDGNDDEQCFISC